MESCHNCGLPANCGSGAGVKIELCVRPPSGAEFKRQRRQTVWCHTEECATQAQGGNGDEG
jgi:hypothetical protein